MQQINRRDWLRMLGAAGLVPILPDMAMGMSSSTYRHTDIRVAMAPDNPAIVFDESKCILCGACRRVCQRVMSITGYYDLKKTGDQPVCVHCGQCSMVCEGDALTPRPEWQAIKAAKARGDIIVVSLSPAVRVSVAECFGEPAGSYCEGEVIAALRALGADYVLDTATGADLTIVEEAYEWVQRLQKERNLLPQFTSCCPSWVKFAETFYPELLPQLSSVKSPIAIQGAVIKTFFARQMGLDASKIFNVALTPCTSKKFEIRRPEFAVSGLRGMDAVVTVRELADWIRSEELEYQTLKPSQFDSLMGNASGAGVIFGNTGGVAEAILRSAYFYLNQKDPPSDFLRFSELRGLNMFSNRSMGSPKVASVRLDATHTVTVLVVQGLANARKLFACLKDGTIKADLVEVMACEGGCIGGGGTPRAKTVPYLTRAMREARIKALYTGDTSRSIRLAHRNPLVKQLYQDVLGDFGSEAAKTLLHTSYQSRKKDLGK